MYKDIKRVQENEKCFRPPTNFDPSQIYLANEDTE